MKLTNPESIQENEKEFIDTINAELDWDAIEQLLLEKHHFVVQDDIQYQDGNLIVYNNEIAYKFDFEIKVPLSVIFNRGGECLSMSTTREDKAFENSEDVALPNSPTTDKIGAEPDKTKKEEIDVEIADLISEINHKT